MIKILVNNSSNRIECIWEDDAQTFVTSSRSTVYELNHLGTKIRDLKLTDSSSFNYKYVNNQIVHDPIISQNISPSMQSPTTPDSQKYQLTSMLTNAISKLRMEETSYGFTTEQFAVNQCIQNECNLYTTTAKTKRTKLQLPLLTYFANSQNITIEQAVELNNAKQQRLTTIITTTEIKRLEIQTQIDGATTPDEFEKIRQEIEHLKLMSFEKLD